MTRVHPYRRVRHRVRRALAVLTCDLRAGRAAVVPHWLTNPREYFLMARVLPLLMLLAAPASAAPPTLSVTPASAKSGDLVTVASSAPAKFRVPVPVLTSPDGRSVAFFVPVGGVQVVAAPTDPAPLADVAVIAVGTGDAPPAPPTPPAPPPNPTDPLTLRLKAAYDADPTAAARKPEARKNLAALYRAAGEYCTKMRPPPAPDKPPTEYVYATAGDLFRGLKEASVTMAAGDLMDVRKLVAAELSRCLPTDTDEALSAGHRKAAADLFAKLAAALEGF